MIRLGKPSLHCLDNDLRVGQWARTPVSLKLSSATKLVKPNYYSRAALTTPLKNISNTLRCITGLHCFYDNGTYDHLTASYHSLQPDSVIFTAHVSREDTVRRVAVPIRWGESRSMSQLDYRWESGWSLRDTQHELGDTLHELDSIRRHIYHINSPLRMGHLLTSRGSWYPKPTISSVRWVVAENPNTPADMFSQLVTNNHPGDRSRVAKNRNTPPDTLRLLAADSKDAVRWAVAANQNTPADTIAQLGFDNSRTVRNEVRMNRWRRRTEPN